MAMLALVVAGAAGACRAADLLETEGCRAALEALQAQEDAALADAQRSSAQTGLLRLRQAAARACLGGGSGARPPQRQIQDPVTVPRMVVGSVPLPTPVVPAAPGSPPAVAGPPVTVIACDAMACWASDGSRLLRAGPGGLLGPRGRCRVQGTVLHCP